MDLKTRISAPTASHRKPGPMPAERRCSHPDCITPLSTYNRAETCGAHGGWPAKEARGRNHRDAFAEIMEMAA
jgi:hypothetical protein